MTRARWRCPRRGLACSAGSVYTIGRQSVARFAADLNTLYVLTRAHRPTFQAYARTIQEIFADIRPRLEHHWRARARKNAALKAWTDRGRATQRKQRIETAQMSTPATASVKHGWRKKATIAADRAAAVDQVGKAFRD